MLSVRYMDNIIEEVNDGDSDNKSNPSEGQSEKNNQGEKRIIRKLKIKQENEDLKDKRYQNMARPSSIIIKRSRKFIYYRLSVKLKATNVSRSITRQLSMSMYCHSWQPLKTVQKLMGCLF